VVRVPGLAVVLAEHQVVVGPRLTRLEPQLELGLAVLPQQPGRVVVEEDAALPARVLALDSRSFPPSWTIGRSTVSTAPIRSWPVAGSR
jgi:hypothetical protein